MLTGAFLEDLEALLVPIRVDRAELKLSGGALRVPRTTARAGRSDLSVSGQVQDVLPWAMGSEELRPTFSLVVESQILDLDEMVPLKSTAWRGRPKGVGWTWAVPASAAVADRVEDETSPILPMVRAMDGKAELRVAELKSAGVVLRRLAAVAVAKDGILRVNDVRANVYGGDMKARAKVDARAPSGTLPMTAEVSVDSLQANGLVQEFLKWSLPIHGRMGFSMTMSGRMDSTLGLVPEEIDARCAAGMREGKIMNWGWLKQAGSGVAQLGFLDLEEIPVQQMKASFGVKDSRVSLDDVQLRAADAPCRLSGSAGFDGSLDYVLDVDMPASQLNVGGVNLGDALGAFLTGGGSHIPLRFHIGGTVDQPRIVAGVQPRTREEAKKSREEGKLKEKAKGFLRKLF